MKKSSWKRIVCLGMAVMLVFAMTSCKKQPGGNGNQGGNQGGGVASAGTSDAAKQAVFHESKTIDLEANWLERIYVANGKVYVTETVYPETDYCPTTEEMMRAAQSVDAVALPEEVPEEEAETEDGDNAEGTDENAEDTDDNADTPEEGEDIIDDNNDVEIESTFYKITDIDLTTWETNTIEIEMEPNQYPNYFLVDTQGNIYLSTNLSEESVDANGEYTWVSRAYVKKYDSQGNQLWQQEYKAESADSADYVYISNMAFTKEGNLAIGGNNVIRVWDQDGNPVGGEVKGSADQYIGSFIQDSNGKFYTIQWLPGANESYTDHLMEIDLNTGTITDTGDALSYNYGSEYKAGFGYDFTLSGENAIFGYNVESKEVKEIWNFMDSDISTNEYYQFTQVSETRFVAFSNGEKPQVCVFDKVNPEDIKDKTILTMGGVYVNYEAKLQALDFNKKSDDYRIRVIDYSVYNTDEDYTLGETQLNNDIVAGKAPDIMILSTEMPIASYAQKGVLQDLYTFMDKDEEISKDNILPNIRQAGEFNGKLCQLITQFSIGTVAVKESVVNGKDWNLNTVIEWENTTGCKAYSDTIKSDILNMAMNKAADEFIDVQSGVCNFDSEEFVKLLEFANSYPAEYDNSKWEDGNYDWSEEENKFRNDKALIYDMYISNFRDFNRVEKATFGENVALVGFPATNSTGAGIYAGMTYGISANSKNQDAAWQFIRYFLTSEYQDKIEYDFPVIKTSLDKMIVEAQKRPSYEDENGARVEYDDTYYVNETEIIIEPISAERAAYVSEYIQGVTRVFNYDDGVLAIIQEEVAPYFEGQKTAAEVAKIIQSRAKIYINENM